LIGAFLAVFMPAFQPFGVTNYDPNFTINFEFVLVIAAFGPVVSTSMVVSEFILRPLLMRDPARSRLISSLAWDFVLVGSVVFVSCNFTANWHDPGQYPSSAAIRK
jgi:branched-subunit amino acid ABC-type transport system permease component